MTNDRIEILLAQCAREEIKEEELQDRVTKIKDLDILTDNEYVAFWKYYTTGATYDEIGKELNLSKERVRQILAKACCKVRYSPSARTLLTKGYKAYDTEEYIKTLEKRVSELNQDIYNKKCEINRLITKCDMLLENLEEIETPIELSEITLEELNLSARAYNCLRYEFRRREQEPNLANLLNLTLMDLKKIRNVGIKVEKEIIEKIHSLGYKFKGEEKQCLSETKYTM